VVEVVYEREPIPQAVDTARIASIDIGVNNLAAITTNTAGFIPRLVNGRPMKSTNQYYNKRKAELQARLPKEQDWTDRLERMTIKRTRRLCHDLPIL
jgi:putative transposase